MYVMSSAFPPPGGFMFAICRIRFAFAASFLHQELLVAECGAFKGWSVGLNFGGMVLNLLSGG
jgi:hypothetical protein